MTTLDPDDLAITDRRYGTTLTLRGCRCGFKFADPVPDLTALYAALDDPSYEEGHDSRSTQQEALLARLRAVSPSARTLLDVGAANGLMVEAAVKAGLQGVGIEPSAHLSAAARSRGLDVLTGVLPCADLDERTFDLITCIDVVEHVVDPLVLLGACRDRLAPDGRLLLVTPDISSVAARALGRRWWHLRLAHVGYFSRSTLTTALRRVGMEPELWWRPSWSFEVGYLVERVGSYLPPVTRLVDRHGDRGIMRRRVPLNLFDSLAVVARTVS